MPTTSSLSLSLPMSTTHSKDVRFPWVTLYLMYVCHLTQSCVHMKDKFLCNNLSSTIFCNICYNQQHHVSCKILHQLHKCQATGDADDSNSPVVLAMFSLPLRENSSRLGLCIKCCQRDHVIAPHSIVFLGMRGE